LFGYFTYLVESYSKCLLPKKDDLGKLQNMQTDSFILRRCTDRYLWEKKSKENLKRKDKLDEEERAEMAQIDWYDFVVVDVIEFTEEELNNTVPITSANQNANLNVSSYVGNVQMLLNGASGPSTNGNSIIYGVYDKLDSKKDDIQILDENEIINNSKRLLGLAAFEKENRDFKTASSNVLPEDGVASKKEIGKEPQKDREKDKDKEIIVNHLPEPGMKIVSNYIRKTESSLSRKMDMQRCPLCNENIAIDELSQHMKIEMLDPKWKEINKEISERKMEVNIAPTSDFINYLGEFARDRPDLFGEDVGDILKIDEIKKIETKINMQNIKFDGFAPNMSRTTANIAMLAQQTKKNYEESTKAKEGLITAVPSSSGGSANLNVNPLIQNSIISSSEKNVVPLSSLNIVPIAVKQQEPILLNTSKSNTNTNGNSNKKDINIPNSSIPFQATGPSQMGKRMLENLVSEEIWINKNPVRLIFNILFIKKNFSFFIY